MLLDELEPNPLLDDELDPPLLLLQELDPKRQDVEHPVLAGVFADLVEVHVDEVSAIGVLPVGQVPPGVIEVPAELVPWQQVRALGAIV